MLRGAERAVGNAAAQAPMTAAQPVNLVQPVAPARPVAPVVPVALPARAPAQVAAARHVFVDYDDECEHGYWEKYSGSAHCEECGRYCHRYYYRCQLCDCDACYDCMTYKLSTLR